MARGANVRMKQDEISVMPVAVRNSSGVASVFSALVSLVERVDEQTAGEAEVIPWGCPVPSFGDLTSARVASVGINPSNREFVDERGDELRGELRRFHTLHSLDLKSWADAEVQHLRQILTACNDYFARNPYDRWFKRLDYVVSGTGASFYDTEHPACHLDIIPYATERKWAHLSSRQRRQLLGLSQESLGLLLRHASVEILILNGRSVVTHFESATGVRLERREMPAWSLPRRSGNGVRGIAYHGVVDAICGHQPPQKLLVLGFNHNLQSSYGVTTDVVRSIRQWVTRAARNQIS